MLSSSHESPAVLIARFYTWLDERRYEDMLTLLDPQIVWHRQGAALNGHDKVLAALQARPLSKRVRHVISNAFTDILSPNECRTSVYQVVWQMSESDGASGSSTATPTKMAVVTANMRFVETHGWRIKSLSSLPGL